MEDDESEDVSWGSIHKMQSIDKEYMMKKTYDSIKDYYRDSGYIHNPVDDDSYTVKKLTKKVDSFSARAREAEDTIGKLVDGNEKMQIALIGQNPSNIKYIKNPYVSVQLAAISANPASFHDIIHPAQEVIDTYRIIK